MLRSLNIPLLFLVLFVFSILIITTLSKLGVPTSNPTPRGTPIPEKFIVINDQKIFVEIVDTPSKRKAGLSNRERLGNNHGMLFDFGEKIQTSFWMKDMRFAIDIIWIEDGKIVQIDKDVQPEPNTPDSELKHYFPNSIINYVLEVNAGTAEKHNFTVGDAVDFSNL